MSKKGKIKTYAKVIGNGEECTNGCGLMERRKRIKPPKNKSYFFTEWDYCRKCSHVQHYEKFKSTVWQETERQNNFIKSI